MRRKAYIPEYNLPGYTTMVTDKSKYGLPLDTSREPDVNLSPGSATPNTPRQEDSAIASGGRDIPPMSFNVPEIGVPIAPRSLPTPGEIEGTPTKYDYNMVTRRTMKAYKPRTPWSRQKKQPVWERLKDQKKYQMNKSRLRTKAKQWYKKVHRDRRYITKKEKRREDPHKYERHVMGYHPSSLGMHRHRQHGPARMHSHRNYIKNRSKAKRQHRVWYRKNKHKPAFKRRQKMRRLHPNRFKMRLATPQITFMWGVGMQMGQVLSVGDMVTFSDMQGNVYSLSPSAFLHSVVFDSAESMDLMFDTLDEIGPDAYSDMQYESLEEVSKLYEVETPILMSSDPDVLSAVAKSIVEDAMSDWDTLSPMAVRVASRYLLAIGEVMLYDQQAPGEWEKPDTGKRPYKSDSPDQWRSDPGAQTHTPSGDMPVVEESGVNFPASSAKVIPDTMKYAATISELEHHVAPDVLKRSKSVKVSLSKADPDKGFWSFKVAGSKGESYIVRVKAIASGNTKDVGKLPVQVSCTCDFFQYQGPEHWAKLNGYLYGKPRGTATKPTEKDPNGKNWACKHVLACLRLSAKYKMASKTLIPLHGYFVPVW